MSGRRLDVTPTQAVSSLLATLTGAFAASGLGIAGTIIGAAFMSLASTVGAAIYKHYLGRSNEKLRAAATSLAPKASGGGVAAAVLRRHLHLDPDETAHLRPDGQAVVAAREDTPDHPPATAVTWVDAATAARTTAGRAAAGQADTGTPSALTRDDAAAAATAAVAADIAAAVLGDRTTLGHESLGYTATEHPVTGVAADASPTAADLWPTDGTAAEPDRTARLGSPGARPAADPDSVPAAARPASRRRWLVMAGAVLAAFVVAMSAVTAVEAIAGKPLETLIWHRAGSGTTIGNAIGHHRSHQPGTGTSTSPGQSASARPGSTSPSTPAPTPSESAAPSTGTSSGPVSSTSAGTGTQAPGAPATTSAG
jgi:hypothetical protein